MTSNLGQQKKLRKVREKYFSLTEFEVQINVFRFTKKILTLTSNNARWLPFKNGEIDCIASMWKSFRVEVGTP